MKNLEKSGDFCALRPSGSDYLFPDVLQNSPPPDVPLNVVPLSVAESDWNPTSGARPLMASPASE
jgi:hypothetical protein